MSRAEPPTVMKVIGEDSSKVCTMLFRDLVMLTGSQAGAIKEWNLQTLRPECVLQESAESSILSLISCGPNFISREKNGPVRCWEKHESQWISSLLTDQSFGFSNIQADEVDNVVCIPGDGGLVLMYSVKTQSKVAEFKHKRELSCIKMIRLADMPYLMSAHTNGDVCLWDFRTTKIVNTLKVDSWVTAVDFSSETGKGLCGTVLQDVHVFNIDQAQTLCVHKTFEITNEGVQCVCVRPDNKIVALGCWDGTVRIFSWKSLRPLAALDQFDSTVQDLAFVNQKPLSKDGRYILAACGDKHVALWDLYN